MMSSRLYRYRWLLMVVLLLAGFALRLYRLDYQSVWWDEGISLHLATSGMGEIILDRLNNIHPPLYFFILKGWLALVGVTPFTGRYLSTLAGFAQIAVVFAVARHWSGRVYRDRSPIPWIAAFLLLISPLSVIYAQEIRVYAMLPLCYLAMLWQAERLLDGERLTARSLLILGVLQWTGLHLHYIAIFAVAYIALWGVVVLSRRQDWSGLRRWIVLHALVALASLPWLAAVLSNWVAVRAEAGAGTFTTDPVPPLYLLAQVWTFHLTGLAGALSSDLVRAGAAMTAICLTGLAIICLSVNDGEPAMPSSRRAMLARLMAHWLVPLTMGFVAWSVRSFSHPRYITMFAVMLIPVAAWLLYPVRRAIERPAAIVLAVCLLGLSVWGLARYYFNPDTAKPDMRGVARYLESVATGDDLILIEDTDWSLPFEYKGSASVVMPGLDEAMGDAGVAPARILDCTGDGPCAAVGRVFTVDYPRNTRDMQQRMLFELERRGTLISEQNFADVRVREYRLDSRPGMPLDCDAEGMARPPVRFGPLRLEAAWAEQGAPADTAVAVALCWRAEQAVTENFAASLVLRDPVTGERITQTDASLLDSTGAPTSHWSPGQAIVTYHLLYLPSGTPPVDAQLSIGVYNDDDETRTPMEAFAAEGAPAGRLIPLSEVTLGPPSGFDASPYRTPGPPVWSAPAAMAGGDLLLLGASFSPGPYRPGQTVRVGLTWQLAGLPSPDLAPGLTLEQDGRAMATNDAPPVNGRYPVEQWAQGQTVFEYRDVRVPAGADGSAKLVVTLGEERVELGEVAIDGATILFERPVGEATADVRFGDEGIRLVGFDPPPTSMPASQPFMLTLYWHLPDGRVVNDYTVFVHLLAEDGRLLAQHDGIPAGGQRSTSEWLPGEYIIDPHEMTWRETGYTGPARIAVGLYDPTTGARLNTENGSDAYVLPLDFTIR